MEIHHVAIRARDVARVATFYREVLGLEPVAAPRDGVVWLGMGSAVLMIEPSGAAPNAAERERSEREPAERESEPGLFVLALRIPPDGRERWRERLRAWGVAITHETPFTTYVRDPEGNRIGLSHWPEEACQ